MAASSRSSRRLAALLAVAGLTHFLAPRPYDAMIPRSLPGNPRNWTLVSGAAEVAAAAAVANPRTRRAGALAAAALFTAVFPANVRMARDWGDRAVALRLAAYLRLPLQIPLIMWAVHVSRAARRGHRGDQRQRTRIFSRQVRQHADVTAHGETGGFPRFHSSR